MLKTISAALLAASVIAAPAFAAGSKTSTTAPAIKADAKTANVKPVAKPNAKADAKAKAMNANAAITGEHKTVRTHRHHYKHLSARKSQKAQPDVSKPATTEKRS